jgi:hypothetical protein
MKLKPKQRSLKANCTENQYGREIMKNTGTDRPIILIERDGGLIEAIAGNVEANVIIIDSDIEGLFDEEISTIDGQQVWLDLRRIETKKVSNEYLRSVYVRCLEKIKSTKTGD